ncbi:MAG TPA: arginine deiminase-related protein [Steroidobacteraceae bacterium]|nr:arginine deiminase-related protein [Steroidobacteraceae bacterium]
MVQPAAFGFNAETAASNAMQRSPSTEAATLNRVAGEESAGLRRALESEGVRVLWAEDTLRPAKPDALFPNNWVSFHADGTLVLYPMLSPSRRLERREDVIAAVCARLGFEEHRRIDLSAEETKGRFLEGTGSLVLDHGARVAYACRSPRTDESLVHEWARMMNFTAVVFDATDAQDKPYYHTNVMMWIGTRCAMVCAAAIAAGDRERVYASLRSKERELIEIDRTAVAAFAGNMLELATWDEALGDASVLVMSDTARAVLAGPQLQQLSGCVDAMLAVPIPTIEHVGGGGVRCMLAEVPEVTR